MLGIFERRTDEPTRGGLMLYAQRYFTKFQSELTTGAVKDRLGDLIITVSFTVAERERREL
jgi:hypothetical protein